MIDPEYAIRKARLASEIRQSIATDRPPHLDELRRRLDGLATDAPGAADLLAIQEVEAEMCLYKPLALLYPTGLRLQARLYRLSSSQQEAWQNDLKRLIPDNHTINAEPDLRQRLRHLTYELNEAAEAFNRLTQEKSAVIRCLNYWGIGLIVALLILQVLVVRLFFPATNPGFQDWLIVALPAGSLGAAVTAISAMRDENARRGEYLRTLIAQMVVRVFLGAVYAIVVMAAVLGNAVPLKIPDDAQGKLALLLAVAVAAGFSDKLFGQAISQLIKPGGDDSKSGDGKVRGRRTQRSS